MTSIIKFQPLSGCMDEKPSSYLLFIDEFTFLLDCGWNETFTDHQYIAEITKHVKRIDAVLLSMPDGLHLGALPYLVGKLNLNCPIYATVPVYKMGQMFMYDLHQSRHNYEDFNLFSLDDVDAAFDMIIQLKYNQSVALKGKGQGLTITPLPAGHMIGGTIWRIVKDGEEDIVYAVDFNHKRERHLNNCALESIQRPSLLITDAYNANHVQSRRKLRDEQLMTKILKTLRNDGNVLIAVDTAGRLLELAHMLDQLWRAPDSGLMVYSLALLNTVSYNVIDFAKSQVEWMSDKIIKSFEGQRNNPFQFKHLQLCHVYADIARVRGPKVVLASQPDLECGFSRELFIEWAKNPKNSIILTQRCSEDTLAAQLMQSSKSRFITLEIKERIPLQGLELEEYRRQQKIKQQNRARAKLEAESDSDSEDNESMDEPMDVDGAPVGARRGRVGSDVAGSSSALTSSAGGGGHVKHDLMMPKGEGKVKGGGFFKQAKKSYPMYPAPEQRIKWDDYGEIINPEEFMIFDHSAAAGVSGMAAAEAEENKENKKELEEAQLQQDAANEMPTKCITNVQTFNVNASIQYIDFEGRSDGESLKKIISMIKPRRLILVRGSPQSTKSLQEYCRSVNAASNRIYTPKLYEVVDATTESHIYQVKLKDSLVSSLSFGQSKDGAELAWVEGMIEMPEEESLMPQTDVEKQKMLSLGLSAAAATGEKPGTEVAMPTDGDCNEIDHEPARELLPTLELLPAGQIPSHVTIFVNELKLSDFKQVLMKNGIGAEFSGGVLYCSNQVAVRRNEAGRIHLEGTLCEEYFKIRELLYQQYAII